MISQNRNTMIAKIHIAKKDLCLCDDAYKDMLERVTGKDSCKNMKETELKAVLTEFKNQGWIAKMKAPKRAGKRPMSQDPQLSKIRAMWLSLYHLGEVHNPDEKALNEYVKRMANVSDMNWMRHENADIVINGLRSWMERVGVNLPKRDDIDGRLSKFAVITAQLNKLQIEDASTYLEDRGFKNFTLTTNHTTLDQVIERLGKDIRCKK